MELTSFETAIKNYLDNYIKGDPDPDFIEKYNNPKKSISECCKYIISEVRKARKNNENCVAVADDEIYGLAIHYFDEDDIVVNFTPEKVEVQPSVPQVHPVPESKPKTRKPRAKKSAQSSSENEITEVVEVDENIPEPLDVPLL